MALLIPSLSALSPTSSKTKAALKAKSAMAAPGPSRTPGETKELMDVDMPESHDHEGGGDAQEMDEHLEDDEHPYLDKKLHHLRDASIHYLQSAAVARRHRQSAHVPAAMSPVQRAMILEAGVLSSHLRIFLPGERRRSFTTHTSSSRV